MILTLDQLGGEMLISIQPPLLQEEANECQ